MDKELLKRLKTPGIPFGAIPFDELIFNALGSSASSSERPTLIV